MLFLHWVSPHEYFLTQLFHILNFCIHLLQRIAIKDTEIMQAKYIFRKANLRDSTSVLWGCGEWIWLAFRLCMLKCQRIIPTDTQPTAPLIVVATQQTCQMSLQASKINTGLMVISTYYEGITIPSLHFPLQRREKGSQVMHSKGSCNWGQWTAFDWQASSRENPPPPWLGYLGCIHTYYVIIVLQQSLTTRLCPCRKTQLWKNCCSAISSNMRIQP